MSHEEFRTASAAARPSESGYPGHGDPVEWERALHALSLRFAPHVEAAADAVRQAENDLAEATEALERARREAEGSQYQSDRLVFMRATLTDEVEGLSRKSTPKKLRVAYRYLVARATELAEGEVAGYRADLAAQEREREHSVSACQQAERRAQERLDEARALQGRVGAAEQEARNGLAVLSEKLHAQGESLGSI